MFFQAHKGNIKITALAERVKRGNKDRFANFRRPFPIFPDRCVLLTFGLPAEKERVGKKQACSEPMHCSPKGGYDEGDPEK